ncbi:hypothetical protein Cadr_000006265 [Camelus dromedarius]|uniref:Uncharacterized protein n=1 Tax=Camelus dromedarius TaxID=9838 RepID=A0A5N4E259_CAMDR|nr:hypothetical protein Cadr_000006265 [Camelus dromedarius]
MRQELRNKQQKTDPEMQEPRAEQTGGWDRKQHPSLEHWAFFLDQAAGRRGWGSPWPPELSSALLGLYLQSWELQPAGGSWPGFILGMHEGRGRAGESCLNGVPLFEPRQTGLPERGGLAQGNWVRGEEPRPRHSNLLCFSASALFIFWAGKFFVVGGQGVNDMGLAGSVWSHGGHGKADLELFAVSFSSAVREGVEGSWPVTLRRARSRGDKCLGLTSKKPPAKLLAKRVAAVALHAQLTFPPPSSSFPDSFSPSPGGTDAAINHGALPFSKSVRMGKCPRPPTGKQGSQICNAQLTAVGSPQVGEMGSRGSWGVEHVNMGSALNPCPPQGKPAPQHWNCRDLGLRIVHQAWLIPSRLELSFPLRQENKPQTQGQEGPGSSYDCLVYLQHLGSQSSIPLCYGPGLKGRVSTELANSCLLTRKRALARSDHAGALISDLQRPHVLPSGGAEKGTLSQEFSASESRTRQHQDTEGGEKDETAHDRERILRNRKPRIQTPGGAFPALHSPQEVTCQGDAPKGTLPIHSAVLKAHRFRPRCAGCCPRSCAESDHPVCPCQGLAPGPVPLRPFWKPHPTLVAKCHNITTWSSPQKSFSPYSPLCRCPVRCWNHEGPLSSPCDGTQGPPGVAGKGRRPGWSRAVALSPGLKASRSPLRRPTSPSKAQNEKRGGGSAIPALSPGLRLLIPASHCMDRRRPLTLTTPLSRGSALLPGALPGATPAPQHRRGPPGHADCIHLLSSREQSPQPHSQAKQVQIRQGWANQSPKGLSPRNPQAPTLASFPSSLDLGRRMEEAQVFVLTCSMHWRPWLLHWKTWSILISSGPTYLRTHEGSAFRALLVPQLGLKERKIKMRRGGPLKLQVHLPLTATQRPAPSSSLERKLKGDRVGEEGSSLVSGKGSQGISRGPRKAGDAGCTLCRCLEAGEGWRQSNEEPAR